MIKRFEKIYLRIGFPDNDVDGIPAIFMAWITAFIVTGFIIFRIAIGIRDANIPTECKAESINDILLSPAYALGCNLAKKRFDLKLN